MNKVEQAFQLKAKMNENLKLQKHIKNDYRELDFEFEMLISTMNQEEQLEYARRLKTLQAVYNG